MNLKMNTKQYSSMKKQQKIECGSQEALKLIFTIHVVSIDISTLN